MPAMNVFRLACQQTVLMVRMMRTRRQLAAMDARMLADIGISRAEAVREADRAPWDIGDRSWRSERPAPRLAGSAPVMRLR